jgi:hypothetical protein
VRNFWLSLHLPYRCRDAGVCCTSGWPIPLERVRLRAIETAISARQLRAPSTWLRQVPDQPPDVAGVLTPDASGRCLFHSAGCEIQRALGHDALPSACRHFPRQCLIDARGVSVTLSHYCPTAASLLFEHTGGVEIVEGPPPVDGRPEGLDARDALPPSLTPRVLMDVAGYAAWEAHMIRVVAGSADDDRSPEDVLALLEEHARTIAAWRPGGVPLVESIHSLASNGARRAVVEFATERHLFDLARSSLARRHEWPDVPPDGPARWRRYVEPQWPHYAMVIRRFMAAHAFASWMAYEGTGVRAIVSSIRLALAVLRQEAIRICGDEGAMLDATRLKQSVRRTDLLLVHLTDRQTLAGRLNGALRAGRL